MRLGTSCLQSEVRFRSIQVDTHSMTDTESKVHAACLTMNTGIAQTENEGDRCCHRPKNAVLPKPA